MLNLFKPSTIEFFSRKTYYGIYYTLKRHELHETHSFQVIHIMKFVLMILLHFYYVLMRGNKHSDTILKDY